MSGDKDRHKDKRPVGMVRFRHDLTLAVIQLFSIAAMTAVFGICWFVFYAEKIYIPFYFHGDWFVIALFSLIYFLLCNAYNAFDIRLQGFSETIYSQTLSLFITDAIMFCVTCLLERRAADIRPVLAMFVVHTAIAALWCLTTGKWYLVNFPPKRSAIIFGGREGIDSLIDQYGLKNRFQVNFTMDTQTCIRDISVLKDVETVFLSDVSSSVRNEILKYCVDNDIEVYVTPRIGDTIMRSARQVHMFHLPVLQVGRYHPSPWYLLFKRCFDIVASGLALIVLSPFLLITAIAIKIDDGGPVFYTQDRLTKDGRIFKIHKFRSMRVDAERDGVARLSTGENDDRITRVGRFIRKTRIDELPQLIDILRGDLSVVGPRPERPEIAAQYEESMPEFRLRLQAKAGLTGYAQVYGKYNTQPYDKLKMDLMYLANPSVMEDLKICFATVKILFMSESTEGVAEGQITAAVEEPHENKSSENKKITIENSVYAK